MAQPEKSNFLNKLARFVANPTTDWAALDNAATEQKGKAAPAEEKLELSSAEIFAIRYQRQKENRNIRIREFAALRQIRAGTTAPDTPNTPNTQPVSAPDAVLVKPASAQEHHSTRITDFSDKIKHLEQEMVEQWWDKADGKAKSPQEPEPVREEAKTQMLIETQIGQYNAAAASADSDVIAFDPAMLESLAVPSAAQPVAQPVQAAKQQSVSSVAPVVALRPQQAPAPITASGSPAQPVRQAPAANMVAAVSTPSPTPNPAAHAAAPPKVVTKPQQVEAEPVAPIQGIEEQVDLASEQSPEGQASSTFVYRDSFTELPADSGSVAVSVDEQLLPDASPMAEAQAMPSELPVAQPAAILPPEYTPDDLPECLNEPAILFVQGSYEQAEAQLLELAQAEQLGAQIGQEDREPHVLLALLDFYRCTEQEEKFEAASIEMVRHFDRSAPQYQGADLGEATRILTTLGAFHDMDHSLQNGWRSPAELDLTDVMLLRAQLMTQPAQVLLDWQALQTILDDAVEPLLDQFRDLTERKVDLLMWGGEHLLACCVEKIHTLESQGQPLPSLYALLWQLRLELVRIMHGQEDFDHMALEYCVALEESPPSWSRTRCHFIDADSALSMLEGDQKEEAASAGPAGLSADEEATLKHPLQWKGSLKGNIQALLQAVTAASQGDFCMIDCSQLNSVDYPAAVALLEWLMEPQNAQRPIQFVQVNRLLAVFWRIIGITANATVKLRRD